MAWIEVSEDHYMDYLEVLPPVLLCNKGFLVGEACDMRICTVKKCLTFTYTAFAQHNGKYYENEEPMTVAEFAQFNPATLT